MKKSVKQKNKYNQLSEPGASSLVIGVDIGGTNIDMGILTTTGELLTTKTISAEVIKGPEECISRITAAVDELISGLSFPEINFLGMGIGLPGLIDFPNGNLVTSPNFPETWYDYPVRSKLKARLEMPVIIDNDANAATLGEFWTGAAKGVKNFLLLTLGTGVGGGIFQNGNLLRSIDGCAGELGHICIHPEGRKCGCERNGCLEAYSSATGIVKKYSESNKIKSVKEIFKLAEQGEPAARNVLEEAAKALGIAIGSLLNIFNPEMVVIAGRMAKSFNFLEHDVIKYCQAHSFARPFERAILKVSPLLDSAGIIGAAALIVNSEDNLIKMNTGK
jgi:glucokinase